MIHYQTLMMEVVIIVQMIHHTQILQHVIVFFGMELGIILLVHMILLFQLHLVIQSVQVHWKEIIGLLDGVQELILIVEHRSQLFVV